MIFIFDWGHTTQREIGPIAREDAGINSKSEFLYLTKQTTCFRMFFIPTIPTQIHYFFAGNEENERFKISRSDFEKFKPLAILNLQVVNNEITEDEYEKLRKNLNFDTCVP